MGRCQGLHERLVQNDHITNNHFISFHCEDINFIHLDRFVWARVVYRVSGGWRFMYNIRLWCGSNGLLALNSAYRLVKYECMDRLWCNRQTSTPKYTYIYICINFNGYSRTHSPELTVSNSNENRYFTNFPLCKPFKYVWIRDEKKHFNRIHCWTVVHACGLNRS